MKSDDGGNRPARSGNCTAYLRHAFANEQRGKKGRARKGKEIKG